MLYRKFLGGLRASIIQAWSEEEKLNDKQQVKRTNIIHI